MPKYIIEWDAGFGPEAEEVEAKNEDEAGEIAYEKWREEAECNAVYRVVGLATDALREEFL